MGPQYRTNQKIQAPLSAQTAPTPTQRTYFNLTTPAYNLILKKTEPGKHRVPLYAFISVNITVPEVLEFLVSLHQ